MHPQHPWMMRVKAEDMQRDIERGLRMKQARDAAKGSHYGMLGGLRRSIAQALIAVGGWIQPPARPARACDPGVEIELAR